MTRVRVATFNIHHGRGTDDRVDLERTVAAIRATQCELIALQELDRNLDRSGRVDQPSVISDLTGLDVRFFATVCRSDGEYGIALAAGEGLQGVRFEPLPRVGDEEPRGAIIARWRGISLVATHLATQRRVRAVQSRALARLAGALSSPVVVLGDLNQTPREARRFESGGLSPAPDRAPTARSRLGPRRIDHILAGPGITIESSRVLDTIASDHKPLAATLLLS